MIDQANSILVLINDKSESQQTKLVKCNQVGWVPHFHSEVSYGFAPLQLTFPQALQRDRTFVTGKANIFTSFREGVQFLYYKSSRLYASKHFDC